MTVRLRPHHLLCILTYVGRGYSPAFTANYDAIARRLAEGEAIVIVEGPDDICGPLLAEPEPHCRRASVAARDRQAAEAVGRLLERSVVAGDPIQLDPSTLAGLRTAFAAGAIRSACRGCEWSELCSAVASAAYAGARVTGSDAQRARRR